MQLAQVRQPDTKSKEKVRQYFRKIIEEKQLPSMPVVGAKVIRMIDDPGVSVRQLVRILSDDAGLTARILAASRSPFFGQRNHPKGLLEAVQVVGFRNLRNIVIASATQGLFKVKSNMANRLWSHSLAVALGARIFSEKVKYPDAEQAFLAGLLHDVGQMILMHADLACYEEVVRQAHHDKAQLAAKETEMYEFDHAFIGRALFDAWDIDAAVAKAIGDHHEPDQCTDPKSLAAILLVANHVAAKCKLGFFVDPPAPEDGLLHAFGMDTNEGLDKAIVALTEAHSAESSLF